jgi:hypothetical protein
MAKKHLQWIAIALLVVGGTIFSHAGIARATGTLSYVGPTLSRDVPTAKEQVRTMIAHDRAVQAFYARGMHVSATDLRHVKVLNLTFGTCVIGVDPRCPINTGKNGNGTVVTTHFRHGQRRPVAFVTIEVAGKTFNITLEAPCVNLLNFGTLVHATHEKVSARKPITFKFVGESLSYSSSSASATCPAGTVSGSAGAAAGAEVTVKYRTFKGHSWSTVFGVASKLEAATYTNTVSGVTVSCNSTTPTPPVCTTCTPPPCNSCNVTPQTPTMQVKNVTTPEEVYSDGETYPNLYADVYAPVGDKVTVVFGVANADNPLQAGRGSIESGRSWTFISKGYDRVGPAIYKAPWDDTAIGKNDQLEATVTDISNSSVKPVSAFSMAFPIQKPPQPNGCC